MLESKLHVDKKVFRIFDLLHFPKHVSQDHFISLFEKQCKASSSTRYIVDWFIMKNL